MTEPGEAACVCYTSPTTTFVVVVRCEHGRERLLTVEHLTKDHEVTLRSHLRTKHPALLIPFTPSALLKHFVIDVFTPPAA